MRQFVAGPCCGGVKGRCQCPILGVKVYTIIPPPKWFAQLAALSALDDRDECLLIIPDDPPTLITLTRGILCRAIASWTYLCRRDIRLIGWSNVPPLDLWRWLHAAVGVLIDRKDDALLTELMHISPREDGPGGDVEMFTFHGSSLSESADERSVLLLLENLHDGHSSHCFNQVFMHLLWKVCPQGRRLASQ